MSDLRRFVWKSGRLISTPMTGFLPVGAPTTANPPIPNLPLETAAAGGAQNITGVGAIAGAEAFGGGIVSAAISGGSIASAEAFGQPTVTTSAAAQNIVGAGGLVSAESFGSATVAASVDGGTVGSGEAIGAPAVATTIAAAGIASGDGIGQPAIALAIGAAAVATIEAFGALDLQIVVADVGGIASDEAIGLPVVSPYVEPQPEPGFGGSARPWRASPAAIVGAGGIASAQAFGLPAVASGARSAARRRREARELGLPH